MNGRSSYRLVFIAWLLASSVCSASRLDAPFIPILQQAAAASSVPYEILHGLIERESSFRPRVIRCEINGDDGELGIAQLHPKYYDRATACDPRSAIFKAASILRRNYNATHDWWRAVAAYNFGLERTLRVERHGSTFPRAVRDYANFVTGGHHD